MYFGAKPSVNGCIYASLTMKLLQIAYGYFESKRLKLCATLVGHFRLRFLVGL